MTTDESYFAVQLERLGEAVEDDHLQAAAIEALGRLNAVLDSVLDGSMTDEHRRRIAGLLDEAIAKSDGLLNESRGTR